MRKDKQYILPPIGIKPRYLHENEVRDIILASGGISEQKLLNLGMDRLEALRGAIMRYLEANLHVSDEWMEEYSYILKEQGIEKSIFKL